MSPTLRHTLCNAYKYAYTPSQSIRHTWSTLPIYTHKRTYSTIVDTVPNTDQPNNTIGTTNNPLRVCVVGSGPSGMYTVKSLLSKSTHKSLIQPININIHILERLPVVFGLVRSGVAPDHIDVKSVQNEFVELLHNKNVTLYANVNVSDTTDTHSNTVTIHQLQQYYHAIVFASGAQSENKLTCPGSNLRNIYTAQQFVRWYNAYPIHKQQHAFDSTVLHQTDTAVVVGSGNVALDVSRILLSPPTRFKNMQSDLVSYAIHALQQSTIQQVYLLSRRGPIQSAFTIDQLRQLNDIQDIQIVIDPNDLILNDASQAEMQASRALKRKYDLLKQIATNDKHNANAKKLYIKFFASPVEFKGTDSVDSVVYERTALTGEPGSQRAISIQPQQHNTIDTKLVISAIGSVVQLIDNLPYDTKHCIIPSINTRVIDPQNNNAVIRGMYVVGWLRRGATGIIGTNIPDGKQCANAIIEDIHSNTLNQPSNDSVPDVLQHSSVITFDQWKQIEQTEIEQGNAQDKPREKVYDIEQLMSIAQHPNT